MTKSLTTKLLSRSAIVAALAISPIAANAANITIDEAPQVTVTQSASAPDDVITVEATGDLAVAGAVAIDTTDETGVDIIVNTTDTADGVAASGNFAAIDGTDAATTIDVITVTSGTITSDEDDVNSATIDIQGATAATAITVGANGTISNTATGGDAIRFDDNATGQAYTVTVTNAGTISTTDNGGSVAIAIVDGDNGSSVVVGNTGTINAGAAGTAVSASDANTATVNNSGAGAITGAIVTNTGALTVTNAGTSTIAGAITTTSGLADIDVTGGTVTGAVTLGDNAGSTLDVNGGTLNGNVVMDQAGQIFTFTDGAFAGTVNGAGQFHIDSDLTTQAIGNVTEVTEIEISNGAVVTVGDDIQATDINVDTGTLDLTSTARAITGTGNITVGAVGDGIIDLSTADHTNTGTFDTTDAADKIIVGVFGTEVRDTGSLTSTGAANIAVDTKVGC